MTDNPTTSKTTFRERKSIEEFFQEEDKVNLNIVIQLHAALCRSYRDAEETKQKDSEDSAKYQTECNDTLLLILNRSYEACHLIIEGRCSSAEEVLARVYGGKLWRTPSLIRDLLLASTYTLLRIYRRLLSLDSFIIQQLRGLVDPCFVWSDYFALRKAFADMIQIPIDFSGCQPKSSDDFTKKMYEVPRTLEEMDRMLREFNHCFILGVKRIDEESEKSRKESARIIGEKDALIAGKNTVIAKKTARIEELEKQVQQLQQIINQDQDQLKRLSTERQRIEYEYQERLNIQEVQHLEMLEQTQQTMRKREEELLMKNRQQQRELQQLQTENQQLEDEIGQLGYEIVRTLEIGADKKLVLKTKLEQGQEEKKRFTEEKKRFADEQQQWQEEKKCLAEEKKRLAEEQQQWQEEKKRLAEEKKRLAEEQQQLQEEKRRLAEEKRRGDQGSQDTVDLSRYIPFYDRKDVLQAINPSTICQYAYELNDEKKADTISHMLLRLKELHHVNCQELSDMILNIAEVQKSKHSLTPVAPIRCDTYIHTKIDNHNQQSQVFNGEIKESTFGNEPDKK